LPAHYNSAAWRLKWITAHWPNDQRPDRTRRSRPCAPVTALVRTACQRPSPPITNLPSLSTAARGLSSKPMPCGSASRPLCSPPCCLRAPVLCSHRAVPPLLGPPGQLLLVCLRVTAEPSPPPKPAPSIISFRHHRRTPCTKSPWAPPRRQQPLAAPRSSCHRGDLCLDPAVLADHLAGDLNRSSAPPPSFPAAQFVSLWRSHPVSFFVPLLPSLCATSLSCHIRRP
jgi:hypothetical protein